MLHLNINDKLPHIKHGNIACFEIDDIDNEALKDFILEYKANNKGIVSSNVGGWHSTYKFHEEQTHDEFKKLQDHIIKCATKICDRRDYHETASIDLLWANVNSKGDSNIRHNHWSKRNALSACYYVYLDDPSGAFVTTDTNITIQPKAGMLLIFPSELFHKVLPYEGNIRISIACNLIGDYYTL